MRWLSFVVLGACQFTPGELPDAGGTGDALIDVRSIDTPAGNAPKVRRLDPDDAQITGGPHTDFPLLVSLNASWLKTTGNGGDVATATGLDIHFSLDMAGSTALSHEIEDYQPATGILVAWVKIPSLAPNTVLYIHYGDPAWTTPPAASAVWSSSYAIVIHMAGGGDSTAANTTVTPAAAPSTTGKIGPARTFDGSTSLVSAGTASAFTNVFAGGGTAEAWFYADTYGENSRGRIMEKGGAAGWGMFVNNNNATATLDFIHGCSGGMTIGQWRVPDNSATLSTWHHVAITYNKDSTSSQPVMYVDGASRTITTINSPNGSMLDDSASPLIGGSSAAVGVRSFDGVLDELRLSTTLRSAGWISTEWENQSDPSTFMTVSAPL